MNYSKETSLFLSKHQLISSMNFLILARLYPIYQIRLQEIGTGNQMKNLPQLMMLPVLNGSLDSKNQKSREALTKDGLSLE
jgi:hypothetical protein